MKFAKINLTILSEKQRRRFIQGYFLLVKKWEKEFKHSLKDKILSFCSKIVWNFLLKKDSKTFFENSIAKRKELLKFANNDAEKEIINCWIIMDQETMKWKDYFSKIISLQSKQKELSLMFIKTKKFGDAKNLFENQNKLISQWDNLEKSTLFKVKQQERIKELGRKLKDIKKGRGDVILLGVITDIISRNQNLVGIQASLIYSVTKNYKPEILNSVLLTKRLKENSLKNKSKIEVILKDMNNLILEVKKNGKSN